MYYPQPQGGQIQISPPDQSAFLGYINPVQPPFVIPTGLPPQYKAYEPLVTGLVLAELHARSNQNQLRSFLFNVMSYNRWNNNDLGVLINTAADLGVFLAESQRMRPEDAFANAAVESITAMMAIKYFENQQVLQPYINQADYQQLQGILNAFQARQQAIRQATQQRMQPQMYGQQMPMMRPAGPGMGMGMPMGMGMGMGMQRQAPSAASSIAQMGMAAQQVQQTPTGQGTPLTPGSTGVTYDPKDFSETHQPSHVRPVRGREAVPAASTHPTTQPTEQVPAQVSTSEPEPDSGIVVVDPEHIWDEVLIRDSGAVLRPAFKSGWKPTWSIDEPHPILCDYSTHMLFHVKYPNGTVKEVLLKMEKEMEYLLNELDPALRQRALDAQDRADGWGDKPAWGLAQVFKPVAGEAYAEPVPEAGEIEDVKADTPYAIPKVVQVASLDQALLVIAQAEKKNPQVKTEGGEYYYDILTVIPTPSDHRALVSNVKDAMTVDEIVTAGQTAAKSADASVWRTLVSRATQRLNNGLRCHLSLEGWRVDDFFEDLLALKEALAVAYGNGLLPKLDMLARRVLDQAWAVVELQDAKDFLARRLLSEDQEELSVTVDEYLVLTERTSITRTQWASTEVPVDFRIGGAIPSEQMPELYRSLSALVERTMDYPVAFAHRYLLTQDGVALELYDGFLVDNSLLLYQA